MDSPGHFLAVPGQPLTFNLDASESGVPAGTAYAYSVQWGDGSPAQNFSGSSAAQAPHTYVAPGAYTITVTATDQLFFNTNQLSVSISITTVAMETDPADKTLMALYVGGTPGNDTIAITPATSMGPGGTVINNGVKVGMNFVNYGSFFPTGQHVIVYSQSGNDIIKTAAQTLNGMLTYVNVPLIIFAGGGTDILNVTGSMAGNVLVGGGGADRLMGGQGRDILIAGAGASTLQAGNPPPTNLAQGGAILIGGTTAYDNNAVALAALLAEWSRTDIDYTTRMDHLLGTMTGGMNGPYFLIPRTPTSSGTVYDNGMIDKLYGGGGMDWYFADTMMPAIMDMIFNKTTGEMVTSIT